MPDLLALIPCLLFLVPAQGPGQEKLLDTIKELGIENDYIRAQAAEKVKKLGADLVPVIRRLLQGDSLSEKRLAAQAASLIGTAAEPLVEILTKQLESPDLELRGQSLAALGGIGRPARSALPALDKLPMPLDPETRRLVLIVRSRLMQDPGKLWKSYVAAAQAPSSRMRFAGVTLAFQWCKSHKDIVSRFLPLTRDPDTGVRRQTQKLMASLGLSARDELFAIARSKNPLASVQAMMMLGYFELLPEQLAFLLRELERQPRNQAAAQGLLAAGEKAYPAVLARFEELVQAKAAPEVLDRFLFYFQGYGIKAKGLGKVLGSLLSRSARGLRKHVLETLRDTGYEDPEVEKAILGQLSAKDRKLSEVALAALGSSRKPGTGMLELLVALLGSSKNSAIRKSAALALGRLGDRAEPAFAQLADVLEKGDAKGQALAAVALGQMGPLAVTFLKKRYAAATSPKSRARIFAAFGELGPKARSALPLMQKALEGVDADLREAALLTLARVGDAGRVAIPSILTILENAKASVELRLAACTALSLLGVGDARLVQPLITTSRSTDKELARLSILALGEIARPDVLPRLIEALDDPDPQLRWRAAAALGRLGHDATKAIPLLEARQADPDSAVRYQAEKALQAIKGH